MFGKFKLICLCALLATASTQNIKQQNPSPRVLIIGAYFSGDSNGNYTVLRAFIVNNSGDTMRFWGTNCHPTEFFAVTNNSYMHLSNEGCNNSEFEQLVIPPHRSLLIPLKLLIKKRPDKIIPLKVSMKFYRWFASSHFIEDRKNYQPEILSDSITLRYEKKGSIYFTKADSKEQERKEKLNLPTTKLYTITADETKISKAVKGAYSYFKKKVFLIPVTIHNNSNDGLKYYSMTCSWQDFYHIDNKNLEVLMSVCESNTSIQVTIPAHSVHTNIIAFSYKKNTLKNLERFRVGLNINKNVKDYMFDGYEDELYVYNIVWSNEVKFTGK